MKVAIFDSGLGGLSVLYDAVKLMPDVEFIYYADELHVPYGEKKESEIKTYVNDIINFFINKKVDAIVIACNTATSVADKEFRATFSVPIIGMEPAVKKAVELLPDNNKKILVAATPVTIAGDKLHNLIGRLSNTENLHLIALPGLVRLAENGDFSKENADKYLIDNLENLNLNDFFSVVLGCTHFNYFKENFKRLFSNNIEFIDGNLGTINQLMRKIGYEKKDNPSSVSIDNLINDVVFYYSGREVNKEELDDIKLHLLRLEAMSKL